MTLGRRIPVSEETQPERSVLATAWPARAAMFSKKNEYGCIILEGPKGGICESCDKDCAEDTQNGRRSYRGYDAGKLRINENVTLSE